MSSYVLDTHACLFALGSPKKLGARARRALEHADARGEAVWIPAATASEVVLLKELGRTELGLPALRKAIETSSSWRFLPLNFDQIDVFASLASIRDPFDRLILSAARVVDGKLISKDAALAELGMVDVVWA